MTSIDDVISAFKDAVYWLEKLDEDPEDPVADRMVVQSVSTAIKEYCRWMYVDEEDYEGALKFVHEIIESML